MARYKCVKDCFSAVLGLDGQPQTYVPDERHPNVRRHKTRLYEPGMVYTFPDDEMVPRDMRRVPKRHDGNGHPMLMDDPRKPGDPYADKIPIFETVVDPETGKVTTLYEDIGIRNFVMLHQVTGEELSVEDTNRIASEIMSRRMSDMDVMAQEMTRLKRENALLRQGVQLGQDAPVIDQPDAFAAQDEDGEVAPAADPETGHAEAVDELPEHQRKPEAVEEVERTCAEEGCSLPVASSHPLAKYCLQHKPRGGNKPRVAALPKGAHDEDVL